MIVMYQWSGPQRPGSTITHCANFSDAPSLCAVLLRLFADDIAEGITTGMQGYFGDVEGTKSTMFGSAFPDGWWKDLSSKPAQRSVVVATFRCPGKHPVTIYLCPADEAFAKLFKDMSAWPAL